MTDTGLAHTGIEQHPDGGSRQNMAAIVLQCLNELGQFIETNPSHVFGFVFRQKLDD